jgi:hypothetical protein
MPAPPLAIPRIGVPRFGPGLVRQNETPFLRLVRGTPGNVIYLPFGEPSGTVAIDALALDDGTYSGGITVAQSGLSAIESTRTSVLFNGTSGSVTVPAPYVPSLGDNFTWMMAVDRTATGGTAQRLYDRNASGDFQIFISSANGGTVDHWDIEWQGGGAAMCVSTSTLDTNPHLLIATKAGATIKLWQDGVDVTGSITNQTVTGATGSIIVGMHRSGGSDFYNGKAQDFALWNRAITAAEVAALWAAWGSAGPVSNFLTLTAGLSFAGNNPQKGIGKLVTGGLSFAGNAPKRAVAKTVSGSLSFTGAQTRGPGRTFTAGLSFTGSQIRGVGKGLGSAALSFTGSLQRSVAKLLSAGALSFAGSLRRSISKNVSGGLSFTGALGRAIGTHLTAALSFAGSQRRAITKGLTVAVLSFNGTLLSGRQFLRTLTASLSFTGSQTRSPGRTFVASLSFTGSQTRAIGTRLSASLSFAGTLPRSIGKAVSGALSFSGSMRRAITKIATAGVSFSGVVQRSTGKAMTASLSFVGVQTRAIGKRFAAVLSFVGNLATQIVTVALGVIGRIPGGFVPSSPPGGIVPSEPPGGDAVSRLSTPSGSVEDIGHPGGEVKP